MTFLDHIAYADSDISRISRVSCLHPKYSWSASENLIYTRWQDGLPGVTILQACDEMSCLHSTYSIDILVGLGCLYRRRRSELERHQRRWREDVISLLRAWDVIPPPEHSAPMDATPYAGKCCIAAKVLADWLLLGEGGSITGLLYAYMFPCQCQCQWWIYIAHNRKASNALYTLIY